MLKPTEIEWLDKKTQKQFKIVILHHMTSLGRVWVGDEKVVLGKKAGQYLANIVSQRPDKTHT